MRGLDKATFQRKWEQMEILKNRLLRAQSVPESVAESERLHREFRVDMEAHEEEERAERVASLAELQQRLHALAAHRRREEPRGHAV